MGTAVTCKCKSITRRDPQCADARGGGPGPQALATRPPGNNRPCPWNPLDTHDRRQGITVAPGTFGSHTLTPASCGPSSPLYQPPMRDSAARFLPHGSPHLCSTVASHATYTVELLNGMEPCDCRKPHHHTAATGDRQPWPQSRPRGPATNRRPFLGAISRHLSLQLMLYPKRRRDKAILRSNCSSQSPPSVLLA